MFRLKNDQLLKMLRFTEIVSFLFFFYLFSFLFLSFFIFASFLFLFLSLIDDFK